MALVLAAVIAAISVCLACWAWSSDTSRPTTLPVVETHGLTADQAACLDVALVMNRAAALDLEVRLGKYQALDPVAGRDLRTEIVQLDAIPRHHPEADRRLVDSMLQIADEGSAVIAARDVLAYRESVTGWAATNADTRRLCLEVADFDIERVAIRQSGR